MITLFVRPDSSTGSILGKTYKVLTNLGEWIPIAKWEKGVIEQIHGRSEEIDTMMHTVLDKYLNHKQAELKNSSHKIYYYIEKDGTPEFQLAASHPNGLVINLYSNKDLAQEKLHELDGDYHAKLRETQQLLDFLVRIADEGFAGAIMDDEEPIFFCLNQAECMVVLRLTLNDHDEVEEFILQEDGSWGVYEGEEEIEFFLDQDRCDRNMIKNLGDIPFLGYTSTNTLWTIEEKKLNSVPYVLSPEETPYQGIPGAKFLVLFQRKNNALNFILDRGLLRCEAVRVESIKSFLNTASGKSLSVMLEPFSHRATSGTLWLNGNDIVLDSFSGFWILGEDWSFTHAS